MQPFCGDPDFYECIRRHGNWTDTSLSSAISQRYTGTCASAVFWLPESCSRRSISGTFCFYPVTFNPIQVQVNNSNNNTIITGLVPSANWTYLSVESCTASDAISVPFWFHALVCPGKNWSASLGLVPRGIVVHANLHSLLPVNQPLPRRVQWRADSLAGAFSVTKPSDRAQTIQLFQSRMQSRLSQVV